MWMDLSIQESMLMINQVDKVTYIDLINLKAHIFGKIEKNMIEIGKMANFMAKE